MPATTTQPLTSRGQRAMQRIRETVRGATMRQLNHMCISLLLDKKDTALPFISEELSRRLDAAMGKKCPECHGANLIHNDEHGECHDCQHHWYNDEIYPDNGN